ncbi:MAG: hypothetical protein WD512_00940 [Candidatus Paceibacterota bacterium]
MKNSSTYNMTTINDDNQINSIYRFKFTSDIVDYLTCFAKKHQYVDRISYKEAWTEWLNENDEVIEVECLRLQTLGYDGDVKDKMFKAARYYFRKKSSEKPHPQKRKNYVTIDHDMLNVMDSHIQRNINTIGYSPANGYSDFCNTSINFVEDEVIRLLSFGLNKEEISDKIKKTYKNRYFIISRG